MPKTVTVGSPFASASVTVDPTFPRPNVLVVLVDDYSLDCLRQYNAFHGTHLGYSLGAPPTLPGGLGPPTTTEFAAIANAGVKFTHCFGAPNCSPTRAMLYTGRYATRTGVGTVIREDLVGALGEFSDEYSREILVTRWLTPKGYRSLVCGKWHNALPTSGMTPDPGTVGTLGWLHPTSEHVGVGTFRGVFRNVNRSPFPADGAGGTQPGYWNFQWYESDNLDLHPPSDTTSYITTWSRQRLQEWIRTQGPEPWLAVWALSAAHSPWGTTPDNGTGFSGCMPPDDANHLYTPGVYDGTNSGSQKLWDSARAAIECIDVQLGKLRENLGAEQWDRTWVFVVADNGTDGTIIGGPFGAIAAGQDFGTYWTANQTRMKGSPYASGTRLAMFIKGPAAGTGMPGIISPGRTVDTFVDCVDIAETIRQITGANRADAIGDARGIDGRSFYSILRNQAGARAAANTVDGFSFSEIFSPNGNPAAAMDTTLGHTKRRAYRKERADGKWSLVRRLTAGTPATVDELYHLTDAAGANVDSVETNDLAGSQSAVLTEMQLELVAHLGTMTGDQGA